VIKFYGLVILIMLVWGCTRLKNEDRDYVGYDTMYQMIKEGRFEEALKETADQADTYLMTSNSDEMIRKQLERALILKRLGLFNDGEKILKGILDKADNKSTLLVANLLYVLAEFEQLTLNFDSATEHAESALVIYRTNDLWDHVIDCSLVLHKAQFGRGEYEQAGQSLKLALDASETLELDEERMRVFNAAGEFYYMMGDLVAGEAYLQKAIMMAQKAHNVFSQYSLQMRLFLMSEKNRGISNDSLNTLVLNIRKNWKQLSARQKTELVQWSPEICTIRLLLRERQFEKALEHVMDLHGKVKKVDEQLLLLAVEAQMANKQFKEACHLLWPLVNRSEMEWYLREGGHDYFFLKLALNDRMAPYTLFLESLANQINEGEIEDYFYQPVSINLKQLFLTVSEYVKGRNLAEVISSRSGALSMPLPTQWRKRETALLNDTRIHRYRQKLIDPQNEGALLRMDQQGEVIQKRWLDFIKAAEMDSQEWVKWRYPQMSKGRQYNPAADQAVVVFVMTADQVISVLINDANVPEVYIHPVSRGELKQKITQYVRPFQRDTETGRMNIQEFSPELSNALYCDLFGPIESKIKPIKNLLIIPDGFLAYLPFETLVTKKAESIKDLQFLCDRSAITYATSLTVLGLLRDLPEVVWLKQFFAVANPIFDKDDPRLLGENTSGQKQYGYRAMITRREWQTKNDDVAQTEGWQQNVYFPVLPETETEVKTAARLFKQSPQPPDVLISRNATEENVAMTDLSRYRIVHFATHAEVNGQLVGLNEPFILLGQCDKSLKYDGFLTRKEVAGMNIKVNLAVLSACLTGKGKLVSGEGLVNFVHAFHSAGTRNVLVTLWEVASEPTVEFMTFFYQALSGGAKAGDALNEARLLMRQRYANPYYWAPFVLYGVGMAEAK